MLINSFAAYTQLCGLPQSGLNTAASARHEMFFSSSSSLHKSSHYLQTVECKRTPRMGVKFGGSGERFILPATDDPPRAFAALLDAGFRFRRLFG